MPTVCTPANPFGSEMARRLDLPAAQRFYGHMVVRKNYPQLGVRPIYRGESGECNRFHPSFGVVFLAAKIDGKHRSTRDTVRYRNISAEALDEPCSDR